MSARGGVLIRLRDCQQSEIRSAEAAEKSHAFFRRGAPLLESGERGGRQHLVRDAGHDIA
jgi:hypothetical protein